MPRQHRRRPGYRKPFLTVPQILEWADDYHRRLGRWPHHFSGRIRWANETWLGIDAALRKGGRGLSSGSSLARLLCEHRAVRNSGDLPPLNERQILRWVRAHFERTGKWPGLNSGAIRDVPGETWNSIDLALIRGKRGMSGGSSLAQLLAAHGLERNPQRLPQLSRRQVLAWADAFYKRIGYWPLRSSGPIPQSRGETWSSIDKAIQFGRRGLAQERSLASFLNKHRNLFRGKSRRPKVIQESVRLEIADILTWGRIHRRQTGRWPNRDSGSIAGATGLKWSAVDSALKRGCRGLPGGLSLAKLFGHRRNKGRSSTP